MRFERSGLGFGFGVGAGVGLAVGDGLRVGVSDGLAVGISRDLTGDALAPGGDLDALAERARAAVAGVAATAAA